MPARASTSNYKSTGRAGFAAFKSDIKDRIEQELPTNINQRAKNAMLGAEITKRWNNLPESTRGIWNTNA